MTETRSATGRPIDPSADGAPAPKAPFAADGKVVPIVPDAGDIRFPKETVVAFQTLVRSRVQSIDATEHLAAWATFSAFADRTVKNVERLVAWAESLGDEAGGPLLAQCAIAVNERKRLEQMLRVLRPASRARSKAAPLPALELRPAEVAGTNPMRRYG